MIDCTHSFSTGNQNMTPSEVRDAISGYTEADATNLVISFLYNVRRLEAIAPAWAGRIEAALKGTPAKPILNRRKLEDGHEAFNKLTFMAMPHKSVIGEAHGWNYDYIYGMPCNMCRFDRYDYRQKQVITQECDLVNHPERCLTCIDLNKQWCESIEHYEFKDDSVATIYMLDRVMHDTCRHFTAHHRRKVVPEMQAI